MYTICLWKLEVTQKKEVKTRHGNVTFTKNDRKIKLDHVRNETIIRINKARAFISENRYKETKLVRRYHKDEPRKTNEKSNRNKKYKEEGTPRKRWIEQITETGRLRDKNCMKSLAKEKVSWKKWEYNDKDSKHAAWQSMRVT